MALHIDFETYSVQDIRTVGGFRYAEDPSTLPLILAWAIGDMEPIAVDLTSPWEVHKEQLVPVFEAIAKGMRVCAHNAHFERSIIEQACLHWPRPKPGQWDCTAARARMLAIPGSLEGAAKALGLPLRKDKAGDDLINLFAKPNKKTGHRTMPYERPEEWDAFMEYCRQDVRVEAQLDKILPPLSDVEAKAFEVDFTINARGLPVNMERVRTADAFVEEYSAELEKRAVEIAGCRPSQREKTLEYLESRGYELPNLQAATVEDLAATPDLPEDLGELLDSRIELSRAGTKKLKAIQACASADGRIRGGFLFSAASTRRWSSTGVQMHNLQKPSGETNPDVALSLLDHDAQALRIMFERPLSVLAQSIRGFFESEQHFLVSDYSSVEPRGLAWSANEQWILDAYRQKQDAYKMAAGRVYGIPPSQINGSQRFMGKQLVLGCGYGMGPPKFIATCAKFGRTLTEEEAVEAVYGYRNSVPAITKFWRDVERSCIRAVRHWKPAECGRFTMRPETLANGFQVLFVDMPSGTIAYPKPSIGQEEWNGELRPVFEFYTPYGSSFLKTDTFGGSLVENLIQALTRDILRDGLIAADEAGFNLVGHVHDEGIAEGDDNPDDLKQFEHLLCNSSPWADGLPVEMESYVAKTYRK